MKQVNTKSYSETIRVGLELGNCLKSGDIVCLSGDLGVGKTAFTKGIAEALGIREYIKSPTFTIVNEYKSVIPFYHFDVFRISNTDEMYEIGFDEYLGGNGIVVIEWAENIKELLPEEHIWVEIRKSNPEDLNERVITIRERGHTILEVRDERLEVRS